MENIRATVKLPDYLQRDDIDADLRSGFVTVLENSELHIHGTASRELSSARGTVTSVPKEPVTEDTLPETEETKPKENQEEEKQIAQTPAPRDIKLKVDGRKFSTPSIAVDDHSLIIPLEWVGIFGLKSDNPLKLRIENHQGPGTIHLHSGS